MNQMRRVSTIATLILFISVIHAQQVDSTSTGEVVDAEIVIEKDRQIKLPVANKLNTGVRNDIQTIRPLDLTYQAADPAFNWPEYKSEVSFERFPQEPINAGYQNSVKLGYGNYSSPLFGLKYFANLEKARIASQFFHESFQEGPVEGKNSASSESSAQVSVNYKVKKAELIPVIQWQRNGYRFYGNADRINSGFNSEEAVKVSRGNVDFGFLVKGRTDELKYSIEPHIYSTNQSVQDGRAINSETGFRFNTGLELEVDKGFTVGFDLDGDVSNYEGAIEFKRSLFKVSPWLSRSSTDWNFKGGLSLFVDKANGVSQTVLYPFIDAEWRFSPKWSLLGSVDGGIRWNGLNDILEANQFMDDSLLIQNTNIDVSLGGGLKGALTNNLIFESGLKWESFSAMPFYIPSGSDSSRFSLTYDTGNVDILSFNNKLTYSVSTNSSVGVGLTLYNYVTTSLEKAWHLPSYTFTLFVSKNIKEKFFINSEIIAQGGIEAPGATAIEVIDLESFFDVNINLDYKATERFSVFLKLNNLLNKEYENYIGYPVRGATFKVGGKYRF